MIKKIKEAKSLSSSSAFIIIIVLVVVSVAAIVVGGGDGFSRKYAGIDFREFSGKMLLAQTGVVGKILQFEESGDGFTLNLRPIELDGSILGVNERYATSVVPPREGDTPFSYRPEEGLRVTQGYPLLREYVEENNLSQNVTEDNETLPSIPGMVDCAANSTGGAFSIFFEDVAYETGIGFDDPGRGAERRDSICSVMGEFEEMLLLDESGLHPGIVVQSSVEGTPEHSLSVVSPQYVGGSGFVSTLLADYLRSGIKRSGTSFTENVSVLGVNSGFMRFNFNDIAWSVDTDNPNDFDIETVTRQNMLRLLGFGSFLGHEQENVLSSSWKRWTEWDRLINDPDGVPLINSALTFSDIEYDEADASEYDDRLIGNTGSLGIYGGYNPDAPTIAASETFKEIFISENFQKGQSLSGLADPTAVSYPIIKAGEVKTVLKKEKEALCFMGLAVSGIDGCDDGPRTVSQDIYIERQNNRAVCVNLFDGIYNSFTNDFQLADELSSSLPGNVYSQTVKMYDTPCDQETIENPDLRQAFEAQNGTNNYEDAVSFSWTPSPEEALYREYVTFSYTLKDQQSNRVTDPRTVAIHKCVVTANSNQLCNGDFQYSAAASPVDYKLSSLEKGTDFNGDLVITCQSTTMPGWCAQGVQDGFSSEFGYTWHPYLIENPEAFDSEIVDSPRRYAGGSSGAIVQRLRLPLERQSSYLVTGKVYVTKNGLQPKFWYGPENLVLPQADGTFHVDYPEALAGNGEAMQEYNLNTPLTTGEWHSFSWTLATKNMDITHIAFGGSNNNGFILYDDLSVQKVNSCGDCISDISGDCVTNSDDLETLLLNYAGECPGDTVGCTGDIDFNGVVDSADVLQFISQFGNACLIEEEPILIDNSDYFCIRSGTCETEMSCDNRQDDDGDGLIDRRDPDCDDQESLSPSPSSSSNNNDDEGIQEIVIIPEGILDDSLTVKSNLSETQQTVPNSGGFSANFVKEITNRTRQDIEDVSIIGAIPSMMVYDSHVATEKEISYDAMSNTLSIPEIDGGDTVYVYFKVDFNPNLCKQLEQKAGSVAYDLLIQIDLCDSYQVLLEKSYGLVRDPITKSLRPIGGGTRGGGGSSLFRPECSDGIDNDGNGLTDFPNDTGCSDRSDTTEMTGPQCSDGIDNDGNGLTDFPNDTGCSGATDTTEGSAPAPECSDRIDNDGDGKTDYPADTDCSAPWGTSEGVIKR